MNGTATTTTPTPDPVSRLLAGLEALDPNQPVRPDDISRAVLRTVTPSCIRRAIRDGELPAVCVSRRGDWRVWPDDGRRWLQARMAQRSTALNA